MSAAAKGRLITFEGIEGSGKSTQIERLARRLRTSGLKVVVTREPGGTALGRRLRALLLQPQERPMSPLAELLLYVADRAQHLIECVEPALGRGEVVLCDRYLDATIAYQGYGRELGAEPILALHRLAPLDRRPDRTVLLDLLPEVGLRRARERNRRERLDDDEGRFEREALPFHRRVHQGYHELAAAEPERFRIVEAEHEPDRVELAVRQALEDLWPC